MTFRLRGAGQVLHAHTVRWLPQRHWTVYVVQLSHFDPGYTDLPSSVMEEYLHVLDQAVEWCEQTQTWPEETRFRYVVEQSWIAWHYTRNRPPAAVSRFARLCRAGQIEVCALWANMISDLLGAEEAARLLYPAFELKRRHGIPIRVAQHNDIPGMAWSLATVLADAGVRWLVPGVPDYFSAGYVGARRADAGEGRGLHRGFDPAVVQPRDCPVAYRWEAQDGRDVLVFLHRQGAGGAVDTNLADLPATLARLDAEGYPYDVARYCVMGGRRDNAPPRREFAETIRAWNQRWAFPHLVTATDSMFCAALEPRLPVALPVHRGHWPDTDYPLGATSTAEDLGTNRRAKEMLAAGERLAVVASTMGGYPYPEARLDQAYRDVLKFDEHAWGLSTPFGWAEGAHRREKSLYAHRAAASAHDVLVKSANAIADHVALEHEDWHILVFNALAHERTDVVEVPFAPPRPAGMPMHMVRPRRVIRAHRTRWEAWPKGGHCTTCRRSWWTAAWRSRMRRPARWSPTSCAAIRTDGRRRGSPPSGPGTRLIPPRRHGRSASPPATFRPSGTARTAWCVAPTCPRTAARSARKTGRSRTSTTR